MTISPSNKGFRALLVALVLLLTDPGAAAVCYLCRKVSLDEGLSHSNVTSLTRDGRGFLWIGTRFGLNRYDFEHNTNYYHDPVDSTSLPGNSVVALHTDSQGRLWVATESGTAYEGPDHNGFRRLQLNGKPAIGRSFMEESNGLLIGGTGQVYYFDYRTGTLNALQTKGGSKYTYRAIHRRSPDSYIMVTRWDGLWLFDRSQATITPFESVPEKNIMASTIDSNGVLYYSPYGEGFRACDRAGTPLFAYDTSNSPLRSNIVLDLLEHDGRIWIATDGGGISIYDPATGEFDRGLGSEMLTHLGSVTSLYADGHHNIYAGTVREGAVSILPSFMRTLQPGRQVRFTALSAMFRDSSGRIWMGDDGQGVILYEPETDTFREITSTAGLKITDIAEINAENLLLVTFDRGYFVLDKMTGQLKNAPAELNKLWEEHPNRAIPVNLRTLAPNSIAIITDRIDTYNPIDGSIHAERPGVLKTSTGTLVPFFNMAGRLLCYGNTCITDFDPVTGRTSVIYNSDPNEHLHCAAFDGRDNLYIALDNSLIRHSLSTGEDKTVARLPERVSAMACEPDGRLWIASTRSIHLLRPGSDALATFGLNDGVVPNEYISNSTLTDDGLVLFGGAYGLLRIQSDEVDAMIATHPDPTFNLADIRVDGQPSLTNIQDGVLTLPDRFSKLTLSVIDDGADSQRRTRFRYIVRGGGTTRENDAIGRTFDLSFLQPGEDYDVELSSLRPDGSWSRPQHLVHLAVMAPWFKSPWMWAAAGVLFVALYVLWELRQRRLRRQRMNQQLESYRHSTLEREISFLVNTNYALRTPLTLIYAPLKLTLERLRKGEQENILPELERVYQNTKKMRDTIDMVLELHQVHSKPNTGNLSTHDVSRSVRDSIGRLAKDASAKEITCKYLPAQDMFPAVYDRERMDSVLEIFIRNAIMRSPEHGTVEIRSVLNDGMIRVTVTDHGDTPDPDMLAELFSWYFHHDESEFDNGISFAYAKNIVDLHQGNVGAEVNPEGSGMSIWLEIPAAGQSATEAYTRRRRNESPEPPAEVEPIVAGVDTSAMTALVVEGDNDLCLFISSQLSQYFGKVYHSFNGKDALLMVKQYQPDIVISSLRLPGLSGLELCQAVKSSPDTSHIPVILLTALKEGSALENAYEAGADSYLSKPFDLNILLTRCRNILHTRSVIRNRYAELPRKGEAAIRPVTNADETFILKINKIISENLANPDFGVTNLVNMMATSRSALYSKFKEITGQTLGAYIADMRLQRAKELLADTDLTVNEISDMLGFNSQRYFSTFFKERTGLTPSAFRANPQ